MGDFDLSLIREFRCRPAFYDRNEPRFKDKIFTAHEWQEISNKLGYDVSLLKDRMLQLRNRYNLEKRRLETLREEHPGKRVVSPWPLYDQLHFLSDHIRARRSYKRMVPLQMSAVIAELSNSGSSSGGGGGGGADSTEGPAVVDQVGQNFLPNGLLAVKMEEDDTEEEHAGEGDGVEETYTDVESESPSASNNGKYVVTQNASTMVLRDHSTRSATAAAANAPAAARDQLSLSLPTALPPTITIRRLDTLRDNAGATAAAAAAAPTSSASTTPAAITRIHHQKRPFPTRHSSSTGYHAEHHHYAEPTQRSAKQICLSARERKYAAFGSFISASLLELPQTKALLLVEKFTSELVKVLMQKSDTEAAAAAAGGVDTPMTNGDCSGP